MSNEQIKEQIKKAMQYIENIDCNIIRLRGSNQIKLNKAYEILDKIYREVE